MGMEKGGEGANRNALNNSENFQYSPTTNGEVTAILFSRTK